MANEKLSQVQESANLLAEPYIRNSFSSQHLESKEVIEKEALHETCTTLWDNELD